MLRVLVDPGHGGPFPGAVVAGAREAHINLEVARLLVGVLRAAGAEAYLTRDGDYALFELDRIEDINRRVALSNRYHPHVLVSLHCNAAVSPQARGLEVWTTVGQNNSDKVAQCVINQLKIFFPDRRMRTDTRDGDEDMEKDFNIIKLAPCPAILVEMGFLSNDEERAWLTARPTQIRLAQAAAAALLAWGKARGL